MREFSKVGAGFWTSDAIQALSDDGKLLALYLITGPHSNAAGVFRCPDGYVAEDLKWEKERVAKGFMELFEKGFAARPSSDSWVVISKHFKHNPPENPNQAKNVATLIERMPRGSPAAPYALDAVYQHVTSFIGDPLERIRKHLIPPEPPDATKGFETVSKGSRNTETETETNTETETETTLPAAHAPRGPPKTAECWNAYSAAYLQRYGVEPVRNRQVNAHLAQLVDKLGVDEAPAVASYFVRANRNIYLSSKHATNLLVRDAEGLRTEWATRGRANIHQLSPIGQKTADNLNAWMEQEGAKDAAGGS